MLGGRYLCSRSLLFSSSSSSSSSFSLTSPATGFDREVSLHLTECALMIVLQDLFLYFTCFFRLLWFPFQPGATYLLCQKVRQCRKLGGRAPSYTDTYYIPTHALTYVNTYLHWYKLEYSYIISLGRGGRAVPRGQTVSSAAR